jgi:hypothetical protein
MHTVQMSPTASHAFRQAMIARINQLQPATNQAVPGPDAQLWAIYSSVMNGPYQVTDDQLQAFLADISTLPGWDANNPQVTHAPAP